MIRDAFSVQAREEGAPARRKSVAKIRALEPAVREENPEVADSVKRFTDTSLRITQAKRSSRSTRDRHGRAVSVRSKVRVVEVAAFLKRDVPEEEWARLETMVGEVFTVHKLDTDGRAWVEKWFNEPDGGRSSHSIALEPHEMEIVR